MSTGSIYGATLLVGLVLLTAIVFAHVQTNGKIDRLHDDFCTAHVEVCAEEGTPHAD